MPINVLYRDYDALKTCLIIGYLCTFIHDMKKRNFSFLASFNAMASFPEYPSIWKSSIVKFILNDLFSLNKVSSFEKRYIFCHILNLTRCFLKSFGLKDSKEMYSGTKFPSCLMFSKSGLKGYPAAETLK